MLDASYYDGKTARRWQVSLRAVPGVLLVAGEGIERHEPMAGLRISEHLGSTPRLIHFADGAFCEIRDHAGLDELLGTLGHRGSHVERLQLNWHMAAISALLIVVASVAAYVWGLPWVAQRASERMPHEVAALISKNVLRSFDGMSLFKDSTLAESRRHQLQQGLARLKGPDGKALPAHHLLFRSSPRMGPNAMALPDGSIVVLDELVDIAASDQEVYAVLAHELGHVQHLHGTRLMLQATMVGVFTAWWLGDFSSVLVAAPTVLLQTRYSRAFETEADAYAAALLHANGLSSNLLADMLEKLIKAHSGKDAPKAEAAATEDDWQDYLSSHPAPRERIRALREGAVP